MLITAAHQPLGVVMPFADAFVSCLGDRTGLSVHPDAVGDPDRLGASIAYLRDWLGRLDQTTREAIDEASATGDSFVARLLVDAGLAGDAAALLALFDAHRDWSLSMLLDSCAHCAERASAVSASA